MNIHLYPSKTTAHQLTYPISEHSLEKIKQSNQSYKPIKPQDLSIRSPKPLQRKWDSFWSKAVETDANQARRHIVMASKFKQAIISLREDCKKNNLEEEAHDFYAQLLQEYYEENLNEESLEDLENLMFHTLENLKFNIFIGSKHWNSGINDAMCRIENRENAILNKIDQSDSIREIKKHIENWQKESVLIKKRYKNEEYQNVRIEIQNLIDSIMSLNETEPFLKQIKTDMTERLESIIDSLSFDISQANHDKLRKWQNSTLPKLHSDLMELIENPDLSKAGPIFREALGTNKNGANALGVKLHELDMHDEEAVRFFQKAITSNEMLD